MATTHSPAEVRTARRRAVTIEEALDCAERLAAHGGAGSVTVAGIARLMGIRPPSLYKYFASLDDIYDALFARGNDRLLAHVAQATAQHEPGLARLLDSGRAMIGWSMEHPGVAALLFWRPVPGFVPSAHSLARAERLVARALEDLDAAIAVGDLDPDADREQLLGIFSTLVAGVATQQLANEPVADYREGRFSSLTDSVLEMFVQHHRPTTRRTP